MFWVFNCFFYHVFLELNLLITFVQMQKCKNRLNRFSSWDWDATSQVSQLIQIELNLSFERSGKPNETPTAGFRFRHFNDFMLFGLSLVFFILMSYCCCFSSFRFFCFFHFIVFSLFCFSLFCLHFIYCFCLSVVFFIILFSVFLSFVFILFFCFCLSFVEEAKFGRW